MAQQTAISSQALWIIILLAKTSNKLISLMTRLVVNPTLQTFKLKNSVPYHKRYDRRRQQQGKTKQCNKCKGMIIVTGGCHC